MRAILLIIVLFSYTITYSQSTSNPSIGLYKWTQAVIMQPSKLNGANDTGDSILSIPKQKFRLIQIVKGMAIIQILTYSDTTNEFYQFNFKGEPEQYALLSTKDKKTKNYGASQLYFKVALDDINSCALNLTMIAPALAIGVINFPFKYRPQKGETDFTGAFNFGAAIGIKLPHKTFRKATYSILTGYSLSNIVLDSISVNRNSSKLSSVNNFTAFSFSVGGLVEYQKVQVGLFIGMDKISRVNQAEFGWQYQGKPWVSIAFGVSIFSTDTPTKNQNAGTTNTP